MLIPNSDHFLYHQYKLAVGLKFVELYDIVRDMICLLSEDCSKFLVA